MAPSTLHVFSPSSHHLSTTPSSSPSEAHFAIHQSLAHSSSASSSSSAFGGGDTLTVPSLDSLVPLGGGQQVDGETTEITAKLFLPRQGSRRKAVAGGRELVEGALGALSELTGRKAVDQLVVGWADVSYEGEETDFSGRTQVKREAEKKEEEEEQGAKGGVGGCGGLKLQSRQESELARAQDWGISEQRLEEIVEDWESLSSSPLLSLPTTTALGITSFSLPLLRTFLAHPQIQNRPPTIDHLNLKDCCHIPQNLSSFAREQGVRLVSSSDVSEPISPQALKDLLAPYQTSEGGLPKGDVELDWVLKYTILHKTRGVLIDKGYILSAFFLP